MSLSVDVIAVRDNLPRLNPMLAVVNACATAGISFPPEVIEFFGEAFAKHGPNAESLREAMQRINVPVKGDITSDGVTIPLDQLPPRTTSVCVRARQLTKATAPATAAPASDIEPADSPESDESDYMVSDADLQRQAMIALQDKDAPTIQIKPGDTSSDASETRETKRFERSVGGDEDVSTTTIQFQQLAKQIEDDDLYDLNELSAQLEDAEQQAHFADSITCDEFDDLAAAVEDELVNLDDTARQLDLAHEALERESSPTERL